MYPQREVQELGDGNRLTSTNTHNELPSEYSYNTPDPDFFPRDKRTESESVSTWTQGPGTPTPKKTDVGTGKRSIRRFEKEDRQNS